MKTNTKRISVLIPSFLADEVKKTSALEEITQSEIIKGALENWFSDKLINDAKKIAKFSFDDLPTEDEWLKIQPRIK
jgi:metal-responsive CopG/Arc/MetJ family transcriptional regulator